MTDQLMKGLLNILADEEIIMLQQLEARVDQQQRANDRRAYASSTVDEEEYLWEE